MFSLVRIFPVFITEKKDICSLLDKLSPVQGNWDLIRLGPAGDGGYLVPDDLTGLEACFSPGVSSVSGFEKDCANLGMKVFMADRSVDHAAEEHEMFHFSSRFIGATTNKDFMTFDEWVENSIPRSVGDLILQIDIEGYEYETILNISDELLGRCRIIVVEFHNLNQLWNKYFFQFASRSFEKILRTHACVHSHPNNTRKLQKLRGLSIPPMVEMTFLRNDRITESAPAKLFPHPLDVDICGEKHIKLPACWYNGGGS